MNPPVVVVGEALIDIVIPLQGEPAEHVGGSPANVAIGLARLGHDTELATHIGTDERGRRIAALLAAERVPLAPGSTDAARTSTAAARLDAAGVATYEFDLEWTLDPTLAVPDGGHLHTGSIAATLTPGGDAVLAIVRNARDHATVSYDPNARPTLMGTPDEARAIIERVIALSDVVKASDEDVRWLYGEDASVDEVLAGWRALGPAVCAVTQGGREVVVRVRNEVYRMPSRPAQVVDTVGAGDSFMSGFVSGLLDAELLGGAEARERLYAASWSQVRPAVERAMNCAAITVSRAGANPPTRRDLQLASPLG